MKSLYGGFLIVASCRTLHYRFVKQDWFTVFVQQAQGWAEHVPLAGSGWGSVFHGWADIWQEQEWAHPFNRVKAVQISSTSWWLSTSVHWRADRFNRFRDEQIGSTGSGISRSVQQVQGWADLLNRFRGEQIGSTGSGMSRSVQQVQWWADLFIRFRDEQISSSPPYHLWAVWEITEVNSIITRC